MAPSVITMLLEVILDILWKSGKISAAKPVKPVRSTSLLLYIITWVTTDRPSAIAIWP
jgi:hypothetical protein